jgi:hypothetical protein
MQFQNCNEFYSEINTFKFNILYATWNLVEEVPNPYPLTTNHLNPDKPVLKMV